MSTPLTLNYPGALDDGISLGTPMNNARSVLATGISAGDTSLTLPSSALLPPTGPVSIDSEIAYYTANDTGTGVLSGLARGREGTAAASHTANATVNQRLTAKMLSNYRDAIIALEVRVGINDGNSSTPIANSVLAGSGAGASGWATTLPAVSGANVTNLNASNLSSGTVPLARITGITNTEIAAGAAIAVTKLAITGTPNGTKFLRDDGSWQTVTPPIWGNITGTLSNQTDLQAALDLKVPTARTITAGTGLTGGGDLSANRTLAIDSTVVTTTGAQALTNKTFDASLNTVSNLATSMFAANVIDTDVTLAANSDTRLASQKAVRAYAASLVVGLLDDRGSYDASGNTFPATGGSGAAGVILKGDLWYISVAGTLGGSPVTVGSSVRALVDTPGQTAGNWDILNVGLGFVPENVVNKATSFGVLDNTLYPTTLAVSNFVSAGYQPLSSNLTTWATKTPYAGVLTITTGKTFNVTNSLTLSGTDSSTLNVGGGGTLGTAAYTAASAYEVPLTFGSGVSRSVNAISLDQSFAPTWTAQHLFSLGTITASKPIAISETWNNSGIVFDAFTIAVTNSAANGSSNLVKFSIGGITRLQFDRAGQLGIFDTSGANEIQITGIKVQGYTGANSKFVFDRTAGIFVASDLPIGFWGGTNTDSGSADSALSRISAGLIGVGTGAQGSFAGSLKLTTLNAVTGIQINGAATSGNVLRGNGTNFISAQLAHSDLSGIVTAAQGGTGLDTGASTGVAKVASGVWSVASIVNADISASAGIVDTKLATIATAGKVSDSALSSNVPLLNAASNKFTGYLGVMNTTPDASRYIGIDVNAGTLASGFNPAAYYGKVTGGGGPGGEHTYGAYLLGVADRNSPSSGGPVGVHGEGIVNASISTTIAIGGEFTTGVSGTVTNDAYGLFNQVVAFGGASINTAYGGYEDVASLGSITTAQAFYARVRTLSSGTITNGYGLRVDGWGGTGITNSYGIYIGSSIDIGTTSKFALYSLSTSPSLLTGALVLGSTMRLKGYTVATLPAGTQGDVAFATDLLAPTFMATAVGGGAVVGVVFFDGATWTTV